MIVNKKILSEKGACILGSEWFSQKFGDSDVEYQSVLNALAEDSKPDLASWLIKKLGSDESEMSVDGDLKAKAIYFAGRIKVTGSISIELSLISGRGIEAGRGIKAGSGVKAGWGIKAGEGIEAGRGIEAV